jgi:hypothetical protein
MTDTAAAAIAPLLDPVPRALHLVRSSDDLLQAVREARNDYAWLLDTEREIAAALAKAELDCDTHLYARRSAVAWPTAWASRSPMPWRCSIYACSSRGFA